MSKIRIFLLLLLVYINVTMYGATIDVRMYGAFANDGIDDTFAINTAIDVAGPGDTVVFRAGVYDLITPYNSDHHIRVYQKYNIALQGATSGDEPATTLLRHITFSEIETLPHHVYTSLNTNLLIENFIFDNSPRPCTAGEVVAIDSGGTWMRVQLFDGLPMDDGTPCSSANAWLPTSPPVLKKVSSLTNAPTPGYWSIYDQQNRIMELNTSPAVLSFINDIEVGEYMSWHYTATGQNQMTNSSNNGFTMRNIRVPNTINNFCSISFSKDVTLQRIRVQPDNASMAVGPRDAFHMSSNNGIMIIDDVDIEGVRLDPIVLRSHYGHIYSKTDSAHFRIELAPSNDIPSGSKLGLWSSSGQLEYVEVSSAVFSSTPTRGFDIVTAAPIPTWAGVGTELKVGAYMPDSVSITNSDFKNNAASDIILFTDNATLDGNTHLRAMDCAIALGSNNSTAGVCGSDIKILNSTFTDCGWRGKNGLQGAIISNNANSYQTPIINGLVVQGNTFTGIEHGAAINLQDLDDGDISNNTFTDILAAVVIDESTVSNVSFYDNKGLIVTASDSYSGREPIYAVNGAGITGDAHTSGHPAGSMWMGASSTLPKWFKVDFVQSYSLTDMEIYNFNWAGYTSRGCRNVEIFYSNSIDPGNPVDNPGNWTAVGSAFDLTQAPGADDYGTTNPVTPDTVNLNVTARWTSIKINSNYGGGYAGFSELRFPGLEIFSDVSGYVGDVNDVGIADVLIEVSGGASALTNSSGYYMIKHVPEGIKSLTATKSGYSLIPTSRSVELQGANLEGVDWVGKDGNFTVLEKLAVLVSHWLEDYGTDCVFSPVSDLSGDCKVDLVDFAQMFSD